MDNVEVERELGEIELGLVGKSSEEKAEIKAQELSKIVLPDKFVLANQDGVDYEIIVTQQPEYDNGLLKVSVDARQDGVPLIVDNPLLFRNPPILVSDGTFHQYFDELTGRDVERSNFKEDPHKHLEKSSSKQ
jgi:hypothetical protein